MEMFRIITEHRSPQIVDWTSGCWVRWMNCCQASLKRQCLNVSSTHSHRLICCRRQNFLLLTSQLSAKKKVALFLHHRHVDNVVCYFSKRHLEHQKKKVIYGDPPLHCCNTVPRLIRSWIKGLTKMDACIHFAGLGRFASGRVSHSPWFSWLGEQRTSVQKRPRSHILFPSKLTHFQRVISNASINWLRIISNLLVFTTGGVNLSTIRFNRSTIKISISRVVKWSKLSKQTMTTWLDIT